MDIVLEDERWAALDLAALAQQAEAGVCAAFGLSPEGFEIALLACDDARIAALNGDFRDKPQPTNVLSWPSDARGAALDGERPTPPEPGVPEMPRELGDIAIAFETCLREAEMAGKPVASHVTHLLVHGLLHLLGYDHVRDKDATLMEALETDILGKMGIADPYR